MVVLRGTQKLLKVLQATADLSDISDTGLGDWYVNRIVIDRQPLLLCVAANSLLSLITPARSVKALPLHFPELVANRLSRLGAEKSVIDAELFAMQPVCVAKTQNRSVVGTMVDFASPGSPNRGVHTIGRYSTFLPWLPLGGTRMCRRFTSGF